MQGREHHRAYIGRPSYSIHTAPPLQSFRNKAELAKLRMQLRDQERTIEKLGRERNELNDTLQCFDNGDELPLASAHETLKCERYIEHMTNIVDRVLRGKNPAGRDLFCTWALELESLVVYGSPSLIRSLVLSDTADDSDDERVAAPPGGFPKCGDLKSVVTVTTVSAGSPSDSNNGPGRGGEENSPSDSSAPKKLRSRSTGLMKMIERLHDKLLLFLGVSGTRAVSNQERELGGKKRS
jgi:hypothetical protein